MARRSTGQIVTRKTKRGTVYALRFYVGGERHYLTLGMDEEGWNRRRAEDELAATMAAVRAGTWQPPRPTAPVERAQPEPTFHRFASEWFEANRHGWSERTIADYMWALRLHLLPRFADYRLSAITVEEVDRYRAAKLREGKLAPAQINKTLKRLSQILEVAEEYGHIPRNPARGKRRRVKAPKLRPTWVEPEQLPSLIEAADTYLRPTPREAVALDGRDLSLPTATLTTGRAKTDAGSWREVDLPTGVVEALTEWRAYRPAGASDPLLVGPRGERQSVTGVAQRLKAAIKAANERLAELGIEPISERVTPYSLRRTFASLRFALGDDPVYVAEQMGHADAGRLAANLYAKAVKRRAKLSGVYLAEFNRALVWATLPSVEWALTGTGARERGDELADVHSDMA
jgi:integrase